jgi:RNA polymerase sigma-70 factor (ECF subfamily)
MTTARDPSLEFREAFAQHRPELLRHCYRMMGSFADAEDVVQDVLLKAWRARESYVPEAPIVHWLMRIATTTSLTALAGRGKRGLPQLDGARLEIGGQIEELEATSWVAPAPDAQLFRGPAEAAEARESVAIAFIALLQRLPPKQRAVLLLKDVVGWSSEEIASALELSISSVNSALHRARETMAARPPVRSTEPPPELLQRYVRSWEAHDLDSLVALLKSDVVLAMPPISCWVEGADAVRRFFQLPRFEAGWSKGFLGSLTRANGLPAIAWYAPGPDGTFQHHRLELVRFVEGSIAESIHFIGPHYLRGFDIPAERSLSASS